MTVCFTGHRPDKIGGYNESNPLTRQVVEELDYLISQAVIAQHREFISGMALGVDTLAAEIVLNKRTKLRDVNLTAAVPFREQERKWPKSAQIRYQNILSQCNEIHVVCDGEYAPWKMQKRNQWMVDNSNLVIAVWDGSDGGTANCIRYAEKIGCEVWRINPHTPWESLEYPKTK